MGERRSLNNQRRNADDRRPPRHSSFVLRHFVLYVCPTGPGTPMIFSIASNNWSNRKGL